MLTYTSRNGNVHVLPRDSYGAITAAQRDGDVTTLKMLLAACPNERIGRRGALLCAAHDGNMDMVKAIVPFHPDNLDDAAWLAEQAGHTDLAEKLRALEALEGNL